MPKFTLIKHADSEVDSEITSTFHVDHIDLARVHYNDFLQASGFYLPENETDFVSPQRETLWQEDDEKWEEAIDFKFRNDGPVGAGGADVLPFPVSDV